MREQLIDIKTLIDITDYSIFLFIATVILGAILAFILFKKTYKYTKSKCKICCDKYYFEQFKKIDWNNPKQAAYEATKYGMLLAKDKRRREIFLQLRDRLDKYKYKKDIDTIDNETMNYYNLYKQVCDESL
jgi:hypothetical protein